MATMPATMRRYLRDAARAFERAPVEVVLALVVAGAFSYAVETGYEVRPWLEVATVAFLAAAAAWTGTLLHALGSWSDRRRWLVTSVGIALAVAYGAFALRLELEAEAWRAGTLVAAAAAWIVAVPVAAGRSGQGAWSRDATLRFRRIGGRFLVRAAGASLYAGALFAGLALALAAVGSLFELEMDSAIYAHVFGWLAFALVPWVVVGGIADYVRPAEGTDGVAATLHRLSGYLVVPLVALYYVILLAYGARIGVTGELPKNLVSPLVLAAGGLGAATLLLFDPRHDDPPARRALRAVAPVFVALACIGAWAVLLRVGQYGWTEFRYLRFALIVGLFLLALAGTLQGRRLRRFTLHAIPLLIAGVLLLSAVGPWSAPAVSRRSQQARLAAALEAADLLRDGRLMDRDTAETRTVPNAVYEQIASTGRYLHRHFGREALRPLLSAEELDGDALRDLAAHFGLRRAEPAGRPSVLHARLVPGTAVAEPDGATLYRVTLLRTRPGSRGAATEIAAADSTMLRIHVAGGALFANLDPVVRWMTEPTGGVERNGLPADVATVDVVDADGRRRGRLLILDIALHRPDDRLEPLRLDAVLRLGPDGG